MKLYHDISLKAYNTFGIDVRARHLALLEAGTLEADLPQVADMERPLIVGSGSNLVFTRDYDGTVVRLPQGAAQVLRRDGRTALVRAGAGMLLDDLVQYCIDHQLYGIENLSAIPGTVGAAAVQNVGAYGVEAREVMAQVEAYDLHRRRTVTLAGSDCRFGYRTSLFKQQAARYAILHVVLRLGTVFTPRTTYSALQGLPCDTAQHLRQAITDLRWAKLPRPEEHGSAGSFFKNPVVIADEYRRLRAAYPDMPQAHPTPDGTHYKLAAAWLIDRAGWKGRTLGRAGVWPRQALVLYNTGGCTGTEVAALARAIQQDVQQRFGIALEPEAIII